MSPAPEKNVPATPGKIADDKEIVTEAVREEKKEDGGTVMEYDYRVEDKGDYALLIMPEKVMSPHSDNFKPAMQPLS